MHLQRVLLRDIEVGNLIDAFVVSAVSSLMLVRLYLFLAGYPKIGGGGLHVAHMIWGGLLMLVAMLLGVSFITAPARWATAVMGGLGFGLFIDEIGKFLTSDNNYFFRPAAALIYVVFVVLFLLSRTIARQRGFSQTEYLINAIELLKEAATHDLDERQRRKALLFLNRAGPSALTTPLRELFEQLGTESELSHLARLPIALAERDERLARTWWFPRLIAGLVVFGSVIALLEVVIILLVRSAPWQTGRSDGLDELMRTFGSISFVAWVELVAALVSLAFATLGAILGPSKARGLRMLELAILIWLLVIQPFAFYEAQFFASAGLILSLPLFAVVQYVLRQATQREGRLGGGPH